MAVSGHGGSPCAARDAERNSGDPRVDLRLRGVTLASGEVADVDLAGGRIAEVAAPGSLPAAPESLDLSGYLLLPAPAEPHAHLDKAFTAGRAGNPAGDLSGAIEAWRRLRPETSHADIVRRATEAVLQTLSHGTTAIRSHVDVDQVIGLRSFEALLEVREAVAHQVDLQLVALMGSAMTGAAGGDSRALLRSAARSGAIVGGCPLIDPTPERCHREFLAIASEYGVQVDLHTDETTDPAVLYLPYFTELVVRSGFPYGVAASHCVSLGMQPPGLTARISEQVAAAGMSVICLPQTDLFLQGRGHAHGRPRGLTALRPLLSAGVTVAGGGDNVQDPFNPLGRGDPLETASLLVTAGHLTVEEAYAAVTSGARAAMGLPEVRVRPGYPAELLAVRAGSLAQAVATAAGDRVVIHRGRVVSRTTVTREFPLRERRSAPAPAPARPRTSAEAARLTAPSLFF